MADRAGVLVMAYGTPASRADLPTYYTHIRRGRPPAPEQLAELAARYDAIGGASPLLATTRAQCDVIARHLGADFVVRLGQKHAPPYIEDGIDALADAGVGRVVGLVLAPHYSSASIGEYARRAGTAGTAASLDVTTIESWHLEPAYLEFLAEAVERTAADLPAAAEVVFTAHSLPQRVADEGDPYPDQLRATAEAVATLAGVSRWSVAWQSAGRTPEPWLGPDVRDVLRDRAAAGAAGVVVCPCGFVSDHLETLFDLDIEARLVADELGLPFARTPTVGTDDVVLGALAQCVREVAAA